MPEVATSLENNAWLFTMIMLFLPPLIIFIFLKMIYPLMAWKRSIAFYIGWIPGNLVSCWYLHYSVGFLNAFMLWAFTQIVQFFFIMILAQWFIQIFGENNFE
jgi:hypothetical protein